MTTAQGSVSRAPRPSSLADVLDLILDKGLVIDAYVRVSVVGIEVLTIDARVVIASVDTYLHFAEAVNRLDLNATGAEGIKGLLGNQDEPASSGNGSGGGRRQESGQSSIRTRSRSRNDESPKQEDGGLARRIADRGRWRDDG